MAHNKLQKAIAVSSMAAATLGAGAIVNADNVNSSSVTPASSSSISATVSSSSQKAKSSSEVTLKSSSKASSKASSSSVEASSSKSSTSKSSTSKASSQKSEAKSSAKASSKKDKIEAREAVEKGEMVNGVKPYTDTLMEDYNKYASNEELAYTAEEIKIAYDHISLIANDYDNGVYDKQDDLDYIISSVSKSMENAKEDLDSIMSVDGIPYIKEKQQMAQDKYDAWKALYDLLTKGSATSSSEATSSSSENTSSSSQTSSTSSSKEDSQVSSTVSSSAVTSNTESKSSATSTNNKPNVTPEKSHEVVDKLQPYIDKIADDAEKYGDTDNEDIYNALVDAVNTADKIADVVNDYMQGKATKADTQKALAEFQNRIKELEKAIADEKDPTVRAIMQDELNALKAAYNELMNLMNEQTTTVISSTKSNSTSTQAATKQPVKSSTSKTTSQKPAKVSTKQLTKEAKSMPQTGEQSSKVGVIAGIGALAMAAAGAFLLRKRG